LPPEVAAAAKANVPVIITTNSATIIVWIVFFIFTDLLSVFLYVYLFEQPLCQVKKIE
jgi:hypothetical protein